MKKILIGLVLVLILSFNLVNAGGPTELTDSQKDRVNFILNNFVNKFEKKNGREKTLDLLKNVGIKLRKINDEYRENYVPKRELYIYIGTKIYDLYLNKSDNSENIVKVLSPGIYVTQNKNGIGYTKVYVYGRIVYSSKTLDRAYCNYYGINECQVKTFNNYNFTEEQVKKIKKASLFSINFNDNGISNKNELKFLIIGGYEGYTSQAIDLRNKVIFSYNFESIEKSKYGKSGLYFISKGRIGTNLFYFSNDRELKKIYDGENDYPFYLRNYELMENKKIKLFLEKDNIKREKIIKID